MTLFDLIDKYGGIAGLGIFILLTFLVPILRDKLIPSILKQREEQFAAQLKAAREDAEFRRTIERERLESAKETNQHISALAVAMAQTNERVMSILTVQRQTLESLTDAVADMKEAVARREGYEQRKKDTGPLGEGKS